MKKLTLLLCLVFLLLLGLTAYFYVGGTLSARPSVRMASAADYPEAFQSVRELVDITIDLYNRGLFAAEWLDIRTDGVPGDIAVYSLTGEGSDIEARGTGQVNLKLVTTAAPDAPRACTIQYYIYGMKRTITVR